MTTRRGRGEGGLHWDDARQRWVASVTVGYTPAGKRIVRRASGRTKTEARARLKELVRDHEDGHAIAPYGYTVADAVTDWLSYGLTDRGPATVEKWRYLARDHVIPDLGVRKLRDVTAEDVDRWLVAKAKTLSSSTVSNIKSILRRSITRAQARDKVKRNVVLLCGTPTGQPGRPSKSLKLEQAQALVEHATDSTIGTYVLLALLIGARTEELRALTWSHVDLNGRPDADPPVLPHIRVWRSVRRRRHQDPHLAAYPRPPPPLRRRPARAPRPPSRRPSPGGPRVDRPRPRLHHPHRRPARRRQRPARLPPHRHRRGPRRRRLDAAGAEAQLRLAAVRRRRPRRADRPTRRPRRRIDRHRDRLRQTTAAHHRRRRDRHGPHLRHSPS